MTFTIALCNLKGGTGKTTSAIYLAQQFLNLGKSTVVLDADPQGSATEWSDLAESLPFTVEPANLRVLKRRRSEEIVLIDCPPGEASIISEAMAAADLAVIPTCPSPIEVERMWKTVELAEAVGVPHQILLTSAQLGTVLLRDLKEAIHDAGVPFIQSIVTQRVAIKHGWGTVPTEHHGYKDVAEEIIKIMEAVH